MSEVIPDPFIEMKARNAGAKPSFSEDFATISSPSGKFSVDMKRPVGPMDLDHALSVLNTMVMREA